MILLMIIGAWIALALAGWFWGVDSSEPWDSPEWERRRAWRGNMR